MGSSPVTPRPRARCCSRTADRALPLTTRRVRSIAVIGADADEVVRGGGSALVNPAYEVSPLDGDPRASGRRRRRHLTRRATDPLSPAALLPGPPPVPSSFLAPPGGTPGQGLQGQYWLNTTSPATRPPPRWIRSRPRTRASTRSSTRSRRSLPTPPNSGSIRWTGTLTAPQSGTYRFAITAFGAAKLYLDGALVLDVPGTDWETRFVDVRSRRRPVARRAHRLPGQLAATRRS